MIAGVVTEVGTILSEQRRLAPSVSAARTANVIIELNHGLQDLYDVAAIEICEAGFVSADRSTVTFSPNLGGRDEPLRARGHRPLAKIQLAHLGDNAGLVGAADLARNADDAGSVLLPPALACGSHNRRSPRRQLHSVSTNVTVA